MSTILVATNFSKASENAVLYSASVAKLFNTKLVIFNSFKLPVHASNTLLSAVSIDGLIEKESNRLKEIALDISKKFSIEVTYICKYVNLEQEIDRLMKLYNPPFLVMGMSSKSMEQNLLGNPTTTLISMKKFPVLAIPINAQFNGVQKILFACDLMQDIPLKTLAKLRSVATKLKSEITVFYVDKKIDELKLNAKSLDNIDKELEGVTYLYKNISSNTVIEEIEKEIKKSNAELLVMVPKKYGFWESIIHKSKTRVMASGLNIPLLSIPVE
jgi:nucleotide-binding universal stress UspA family protein